MSEFEPTDIKAQEREARKRDANARVAADSEAEDLKWLMGSKRGRRILWRLLERSGVFRLSFNTNSMTMAFNEGNKNEGIRTIALIHTHCPELYPQMVKEQSNARNADDGNGRNDH